MLDSGLAEDRAKPADVHVFGIRARDCQGVVPREPPALRPSPQTPSRWRREPRPAVPHGSRARRGPASRSRRGRPSPAGADASGAKRALPAASARRARPRDPRPDSRRGDDRPAPIRMLGPRWREVDGARSGSGCETHSFAASTLPMASRASRRAGRCRRPTVSPVSCPLVHAHAVQLRRGPRPRAPADQQSK
jgi:hypothetical protein